MTLFRKHNHNVPVRKTTHSPRNFWDMAFDDDFFGTMPFSRNAEALNFTPAIDIKENDKEYLLEAEMPGMKREDIDISVKDRNIVLKGEKRNEYEEKKEDYHHIERRYGQFFRTIPLAGDADIEKVSADYNDGLLTIKIGKSDEKQRSGRKIDIR